MSRGGELGPGRATGWAAASVVTNDGAPSYNQWRVSTYSWDVPILIQEDDGSTGYG